MTAYGSQLRYYLRTNELVDEVEPDNLTNACQEFIQLGNNWTPYDSPATIESDDDDDNDENEK